jgi:CBS domain-containing protein
MNERERTESVSQTLEHVRVRDVMTSTLVACAADLPLRDVAELMTRHRIHCVVVLAEPVVRGEPGEPWGVIAELDLVGAAPFDEDQSTAGRVAGTPLVTVHPEEPLGRAALLMSEYATAHLVVVDDAGAPAGIVSALDIARAVAPPAPTSQPATEAPLSRLTARPGDRLVIQPHHMGEPERDAEILEAHGPGGGTPFLVRWTDTGRTSLFYPGSDARVERLVAP